MPSSKLLILTPWDPSKELLQSLQEEHPDLKVQHHKLPGWVDTSLPKDLPADDWEDVTILLTWLIIPPKELVPNIKYVQLMSAGCNQIMDKDLFLNTDTKFCTSNGTHPPQIAEWVMSTFLAFQHHIPEYLDAMKDRNWINVDTDLDTEDAVGLRVGIMGYGCIGRQIARVAKALGMDVYAFTHRERATPEAKRDESFTEKGLGDPEGAFPTKWFHGHTTEAVNEFLSQNLDLLVLSMPLTDLTRHMISAPQFQILSKKKAYVSNIGRGAIINTPDLIDALDQGLIRGAALDVTEPEPLPRESPLWLKKNVIITPHVSGNSTQYNERVLRILKLSKKLKDSKVKDWRNDANDASQVAAELLKKSSTGSDEPVALYKQVSTWCNNKYGSNDINTIRQEYNLGLALDAKGEYEAAAKVYLETTKAAERSLGSGHPELLRIIGSIARMHCATRQIDEATKTTRTVLEGQTKVLGIDHPHTLVTRQNAALLSQEYGQWEEAGEELARVLDKQLQLLGSG